MNKREVLRANQSRNAAKEDCAFVVSTDDGTDRTDHDWRLGNTSAYKRSKRIQQTVNPSF